MGNAKLNCNCCKKRKSRHLQSFDSNNKPNNSIDNYNIDSLLDNIDTFHLPSEIRNYPTYFDQEQLKYYNYEYNSEADIAIKYINHSKLKIGQLIGKGNYSSIYQCFNTNEGTMIALKRIDMNDISKDNKTNNKDYSNIIKITEIEMDLFIQLNHKNIINYYGVYFTENKYLDIYLELCSGESLMTLYKQFKCFDEKLIRRYTIQILKGVEYLHSKNIVHSDIKCSNVLIDRQGICKLSDFGCSRIIKSNCNICSNKYQNALNWLAPEVFKGEISRYSDIWSIGCSVIEMLQGAPLWNECTSAVQLITNLLSVQKPTFIPAKASFLLRDFLEKCLAIDPTKRWNVYQLLLHPFITRANILDLINVSDQNDCKSIDKFLSPQRQDSLIFGTHKSNSNNEIQNKTEIIFD